MNRVLSIICFFMLFPLLLWSQDDLSLRYTGKAATALVGDGKFIIKVTPERFKAAKGLELDGMFHFFQNGAELLPASTLWNAIFFPGGVTYDIRVGGDTIEVTYGVLPETGFAVGVKAPVGIQTRLDLTHSIPLYRKEVQEGDSMSLFFLQQPAGFAEASYNRFKKQLQDYYEQKLVLKSPNQTLNKSVAFSQSLLDLGYNGNLMLCELFRWQDIWARDLGSGLLPGGLASGRAAMARQSLVYDLQRYAQMLPEDCKNSNDPSQGGTASEVGWTVRSIWSYYCYSGNLDSLRKDAEIIRPWVSHWIQRDYDEDGLITDVTDFMDHMIMMLSTNGVSTLASNTMFASLLNYASKIEDALDNRQEAEKLQSLYARTVNAINTVYWNKEKEYFNNMTLWGLSCERSSQAYQAMLLKIGATDALRSKKTLDYLQKNNWCDYGSITIVPRMNHVGLDNDQNVKVWPWWNLWEAEARFNCQDTEGAYHLLDLAAATIKDEKYPGFIEETLDVDGTSIGGNVFVTAAGNLLEVVVKDLMGVEALTPGWKSVKVVPAVPADWANFECKIPSPNGYLLLRYSDSKLSIQVEDPNIREVLVKDIAKTSVIGAEKKQWTKPLSNQEEVAYKEVPKKAVASLEEGKTALFYDATFHDSEPDLALDKIDVDALATLERSTYTKIVVMGNRLPLYTASGKPIKKALEAFVNKGGTVVFYGAATNAKTDEDGAGILGEQCGMIDWYQYLPARDKKMLNKWTFQPDSHNTATQQKNGLYAVDFSLDASQSGKEIYIELGPLVGLDSVFINHVAVANYRDMEPYIKQEYPTRTDYPDMHRYKMLSRLYRIKPGTEAYRALKFDQQNRLEVKLYRDGLGRGIPENNAPNIGVMTSQKSWQALDEALPDIGLSFPKRKGINYWGSEQFFNSWSTKNGLFGFEIDGNGIQFCDGTPLADLSAAPMPVKTAYTDFALFKPWNFEVLAYTETQQHLLYPMETERYPCMVRIVNTQTQGGYVLITPAVVNRPIGIEVLKKLNIKFNEQ